MKVFQKIICAIVSLSVVVATMTCMATSSAAVANTPGDVNSDGSIIILLFYVSFLIVSMLYDPFRIKINLQIRYI